MHLLLAQTVPAALTECAGPAVALLRAAGPRGLWPLVALVALQVLATRRPAARWNAGWVAATIVGCTLATTWANTDTRCDLPALATAGWAAQAILAAGLTRHLLHRNQPDASDR